jgi:chloride channel 7
MAAQYECQNYDPNDAELEEDVQRARPLEEYGKVEVYKWVFSLLIGIVMGAIAFHVDALIETLNTVRYSAMESLVADGRNAAGYFADVGFVLLYVTIAASCVSYIEPLAAGSGIPELKTYLNGVHLPGLLRVKTLVAKIGGIAFTIAGGVIAGKEGPFVHGGGLVGGGISAMGSQSLGFALKNKPFTYFRNPLDKRDFVAIGTATGVAVAFGAPIGGMLFMVEEGVSYFSTKIMWRSFLATSTGVLTLHWLHQLYTDANSFFWAKFGLHRDFGLFADDEADYSRMLWWYIWEIPIFALMGIVGGVMGILFVRANMAIMHWRARNVPFSNGAKRLAEAVFVAFVTATLNFVIARASGCRSDPSELRSSGGSLPPEGNFEYGELTKKDIEEDIFKPWFCNDENQHSEYGILFLSPLAKSLKLLLHLGEVSSDTNEYDFSIGSLFVFWILTFLLMTWTYGVGLPSGLFVPSLSVGAAFGQLVGRLVEAAVFASGTTHISTDLHTYAIIGAAASLGGATRMTISITVLVMETTGALQLIVPLMITIFCATYTGNMVNEGIYDSHIRFKGIPFLDEYDPTSHGFPIADKLQVGEVTSTSLVCLPLMPSVRDIMSTLKSNSHHGFPITESAYDPENNEDEPIELIGHINRSVLLKILEHRVGFFDPPKQGMSDSIGDERQTEPLLETSKQREQLMDILSPTPYKPRPADELQLSEAELSQLVDLRPFMQRHPWVIPNTAPLSRAYRLFRNMGLQHMYVIKERPNVMGVVSRKDLSEANAKLALSEKASEAASYYRASGRLTRANVHGERPPPQPQHQHQASRRRPDRGGAEEDAEELSSLVRRVNGNSIR